MSNKVLLDSRYETDRLCGAHVTIETERGVFSRCVDDHFGGSPNTDAKVVEKTRAITSHSCDVEPINRLIDALLAVDDDSGPLFATLRQPLIAA